jgi:hypothetical protein
MLVARVKMHVDNDTPQPNRRSVMNPGSFRRVALLCAFLTAGMFGACQTMPPDIGAREDKLAAAGFLMKPANTPERHAMLSRCPHTDL